ncbi:tRNA (cytosine(38)-C(5))-methyltransferase [Topomyia yanbarensis]|uniref:tRNA (cytosine(38)-C(5))-methyltransferase n=1 Tax=Topomyia yanbarensis TaxID=2498891 RepID=UPI00273CAE98|nr:tRNA (cytosine(38)-C(5))-methyltransferase [Topomyia yanbarensis]
MLIGRLQKKREIWIQACYLSGMESENNKSTKEYRVLELFSGIGGMHYAIRRSGKPFKIMTAIDINPVANSIYNHNFASIKAKNSNILSLCPETICKLGVDVILMSPPCQPFSRNGNFGDIDDHRADPFVHICDLLDRIPSVRFILLENVKGFERSQACELYKKKLTAAGFYFKEYILSPHSFGVPNTRHRYYCVAKRVPFQTQSNGFTMSPRSEYIQPVKTIGEMVETNPSCVGRYLLKDDLLRKRLAVMDVCTSDSVNSMCFTKAYTHYAEGTGSVYSPLLRVEFDAIYRQMEASNDEEEKQRLRKQLGLRYFTPKEVARLMCFPEDFEFPPEISDKQRYRVLGNSINVMVVSSLFDEL